MRPLIGMLQLLLSTNPARVQVDPCVPNLNPVALERVSVTTQRCGLHLRSYVRESGSELAGPVTVGIDDHDAIRIVQNSADPPFALLQTGEVLGAGHSGDTIYWGIWNREGTLGLTEDRVDETIGSRSAMPYVAGVASRSLPDAQPPPFGVMRYSLLGAPFIISGSNNMYAPVSNADGRGHRIDPGPISGADLNVDFSKRTARLNLRFNVRGVAADTVIELRQRKAPSLAFEEVDCEGAPNCSTASLHFYGEGATHAGVLLTVSYDRVLSQADCVAARLANVSGVAAIAMQRR